MIKRLRQVARSLVTEKRRVQYSDFQIEELESRQMLSAANPIGDQFIVNESFTLEASSPAVAVLSNTGDFVTAWESYEEGADYLGFGVFVQRFQADGTPLDATKILANEGTIASDQLAPALASDGQGNYLISWQSKDATLDDVDIYARWYNATTDVLGSTFLVNSFTDGDQLAPTVAMDNSGNAVIAWQSAEQDGDGAGIYAKLYTFEQTSGATEFAVNAMTDGDQLAPDAAMNAAGNFVISWEGIGTVEAEPSFEIFARQFDDAGTPLQPTDILINTTTIRDQVDAHIAIDDAGDFAVVWVGEGIPGSGSDVFGRLFDSTATAVADQFRVNTTTLASQVNPDVGMNAGGEFVVSWQSVHQDGFSWGVYAHEYDAVGDSVVGKEEFQINNWVMGPQTNASVAVHRNGETRFVWTGNDATHRPAIHSKQYELPGVTTPGDVEDTVLANFVALEDVPPAAFMDAAGNSVVAWQSFGEDGDGLGIYAKRLDNLGEPIGDSFLVNTDETLGNQSHPAIGGNADGRFVIVWQADDFTTPGHDIYGQIYDETASPVGSAFAINSTTSGDQAIPAVAMAEDGSFAVVWQGPDVEGYGIFGQRFAADGTPIGGEFQVNNERARDQVAPSIAMNGNGQFVVAWVSDHPAATDPLNDPEKSVFVQWFDADGSSTGDEVIAHEYVKDAQEHPGVGIDAAGNFVVVWQSINQETQVGAGDSWGVFARQFDAAKNPLTAEEILVNQTTAGPQRYASVGMDAAGNFAVAWQSNSHLQDGTSWEVYLRQYDTDGNALRDEESVNTWGQGPQINPIVARAATGNFGVFWSGQGTTHTEGIHGRLYDVNLADVYSFPTRLPIGDQFLVAETFALEGSAPDFAMDAAGNIFATWESFEEDGSGWGVYAQRFDSAGAPLADAFPVNSYVLGDQHAPKIAADDAGNFLIVWQSNAQDGDGYGVYGQWFDFNGDAVGSEFRVNSDVAGDQLAADVAMVTVGGGVLAVVTWQGTDADLSGIHAKYYTSVGDTTGGGDFQVNTLDTGDQIDPTVAVAAGTQQFVIAWQGPAVVPVGEEASLEIFAQRYQPSGPGYATDGGEFTVNSILEHDQVTPAVAMSASGGFVVAFVAEGQQGSGSDVYARRFNSSGVAEGDDFLVNNETLRPQRGPAVGMDADGKFLISWQSSHQDPDPFSWGIFAREYDAAGVSLSDEFLVNTLVSGPQTNAAVVVNGSGNALIGWLGLDASHTPAVHATISQIPSFTAGSELVLANYLSPEEAPPAAGMDAAGNSLVVWQSYLEDGSGLGIFAQKLDFTGLPIGAKFQVNTTVLGNQTLPAVAVNDSGLAVVVWQSADQDGDGFGIFGQMIDSSGNLLGSEFQINTIVAGDQTSPDVAIADDGSFVVVWEGLDTDLKGIYARRFTSTGTAIDVTEILVNTFTGLDQFGPAVSMNNAHQFAVVWVSDHPALTDPLDTEKSVFAQWFAADLSTSGPEVLVHRFVKDAQEHPDVGIDAAGNFVVIWQSINQDGNTWGVLARQFTADKTPVQIREFVVNTVRSGPQRYASVGVADDGRFVVSWQSISHEQTGSSWDTFVQQYSADGIREGTEEAVNTFIEGPQIHPVIAQAPNGEFGVFWVGRGTDKSEGVHGRIFRFPDYGDAPDTYGTTLGSNVDGGARHAYTGPYLGTLRDREADGLPTTAANGDDLDVTADEDGVVFLNPLIPNRMSDIQVTTSGDGLLSVWIDYDGNGTFDTGEQIFTDEALAAGVHTLSFLVPADAPVGLETYARFRFSTAANLAPSGTAADGEVEDYAVQVCGTKVTNTNDSGFGSLRFAILCANATPGIQTITFDIPGTGIQRIRPLSALPTVRDDLIINGKSQPGYAGQPLIEIIGSLAGAGVSGLRFMAPGTITGLAINRFSANGIVVASTSNVRIQDNYLGTNAGGSVDFGNGVSGIRLIDAYDNVIRGNVVSGNEQDGILLVGSSTYGNRIVANKIGVNRTGFKDLGNTLDGIAIVNGSHDNRIGGSAAEWGNVVSGNDRNGVLIQAGSGNRLLYNFVGTNVAGTKALGNGNIGVQLSDAPSTYLASNVISGNESVGVLLGGSLSTGIQLTRNYVGTNVNGQVALGNAGNGISIRDGAHGNKIGILSADGANLISGNLTSGVVIQGAASSGNRVVGNMIGTNVTGLLDLGNGGSGLRLDDSSENVIFGNVISGNDHSGIVLSGGSTFGNHIAGNVIGLKETGNKELGNGFDGVRLVNGSHHNRIGGTGSDTANVISGNDGNGVLMLGSSDNRLLYNRVGTNSNGTKKLGNSAAGVRLTNASSNHLVGNLISGNEAAGIMLQGSDTANNKIRNNSIGTDATNLLNLGNGSIGITIFQGAHDNRIGALSAGTGNFIAFNDSKGVLAKDDTTVRNAIVGNSIHDNASIGIDLGGDGVTVNDALDADSGANNLQNTPVLSSVVRTGLGELVIDYHVDSSLANSTYRLRVEFFLADSSGREGMVFLGSDDFFPIDFSSGGKQITISPLVPVSAGQKIVATATDGRGIGSTSEFSFSAVIEE